MVRSLLLTVSRQQSTSRLLLNVGSFKTNITLVLKEQAIIRRLGKIVKSDCTTVADFTW